MRGKVALAGALAVAVLSACGSDGKGTESSGATTTAASSTSAAGSTTGGASSTTGVPASSSASTTPGGMFGEVVQEYPTTGQTDQWLVWNKDACAFEAAAAPQSEPYVIRLRKAGNTSVNIAWTPQDTTSDNLVLANNSWKTASEQTGMKFSLVDNAYPSTDRPLVAANDVVTLKPDAVMSMNVLADLQPAVFDVYDAACIPSVAFSVPPSGTRPYVAGSWSDAGRIDAEHVLDAAGQHGWDLASTAVLLCINGALGTAKGGPFDAAQTYKTIVTDGGVPSDSVHQIDCSAGTGAATPETVQSAVRDWLTAHPDLKQIFMFGGPDAIALGMYNAVDEAGRGDQVLLNGVALTKPARALLLANSPTYIGSVDFGLSLFGPYGIGIAQDILEGTPVPATISPALQYVDASNIRDVLAARGTTE